MVAQFRYRADSWPRSGRVVYKAEVMDHGDNPRIVVTTLPEKPEALYRFDVQRGRSENWIKDPKNALFADRLSCHLFAANQFGLFLHTAAYVLLFRLRERHAGTPGDLPDGLPPTQAPEDRRSATLLRWPSRD